MPQSLDIITPPRPPVRFRVMDATNQSGGVQGFAGRFHSDELDATYSVVSKDGRLVVQTVKQPDVVLDPLSGDRFVSADLGTVTFTRNGSGDVNGMTVSTGRVRRLRFDRVATSATSSGRN